MTAPGFFELYNSARPALPAGLYAATSHQDLQATPRQGRPVAVPIADSTFHLEVTAPRYAMPPDQILSTFPPAGSRGDWHERMPQIVLKRRTLPWERNPSFNPQEDPTTAPPWLALVVLAEGEGQLSSDVDVSQCVTAGVDLGPDADVPQSKFLEVDQDVIDKVFPCLDELELLCHVRHVDLTDTELAMGDDDGYLAVVLSSRLPQPGPADDANTNGTPLKYTAYLINLEHQLHALRLTEPDPVPFFLKTDVTALINSAFLQPLPNATLDQLAMNIGPGVQERMAGPAATGVTGGSDSPAPYGISHGLERAAAAWATGPVRTPAKTAGDLQVISNARAGLNGVIVGELRNRIRFPVLVSWDFTCTADGGFEFLMNNLEVGLLGTTDVAQTPVPEVAPTGHIALDHRTRRGEAARSWYRGPLVPQPTERVQPAADGTLPLAAVADQLRRVVPDGREDVSLAALFEIGRLLTLNKPTLLAALMQWRAELFGAARARELAESLSGGVIADIGVAAAGGRNTLEDLVRQSIIGAFTRAPAGRLAPDAQERTAARIPDELQAVGAADVLAGLGTSDRAVASVVKEFGVDGLGAIPVPVVSASTDPVSRDELALQALHQHLDARLDELTASVLKQSAPAPTVAGPHRRTRDTLDRLIRDASTPRKD